MAGALNREHPGIVSGAAMRILYLMHVDWNWIWQRPHAFAEMLAQHHTVKVMYRINPNRRQLTCNEAIVDRTPIIPVPKTLFPNFAPAVQKAQVAYVLKRLKPEIIWITHPDLWELVAEHSISGLKIIYDRMDLPEGFARTKPQRDFIKNAELELMSHSSLIICSSQALLRDAQIKYPRSNPILVNNALREEWIRESDSFRPLPSQSELINIWYYGTISHWIDWETLLACLDARKGVVIHLVGPCENNPPSPHARLRLYPPIPHHEIPSFTQSADAYILPFKLNELTLSVNPVKLYEYMALGRPILCVDYPETRAFSPFVGLYASASELLYLIDALGSRKPVSESFAQLRQQFLRSNTWQARYNVVMAEINQLREATFLQ